MKIRIYKVLMVALVFCFSCGNVKTERKAKELEFKERELKHKGAVILEEGRGEPENNSSYVLNESDVMSFLNEWQQAQNNKNLSRYFNFYASDFQGIKKTNKGNTYHYNKKNWMRDRTKMYTSAKNLNISISNVQIEYNGSEASIIFTQTYS